MHPILKNVASLEVKGLPDLKSVKISGEFLVEEALPTFEKALEAPEERAYALIGRERGESFAIRSHIKVPEHLCSEDTFEPLSDQFLEEVKEGAEDAGEEVLGYLHSHPLSNDEFPVAKAFLSETDHEMMSERNEKIRGVCVLPTGLLSEGMPLTISAYIVFWHLNYPRVLPTSYNCVESEYGVYLARTEEGWKIWEVSE